jgi:hypothetical protein
MSGAERDGWELSLLDGAGNKPNMQNIRARLVAYTCVDDEGKALFSEGDVIGLGDKSATALQRVFDVARKLSGLSPEDVEELAEDFEPAPSDVSTSA